MIKRMIATCILLTSLVTLAAWPNPNRVTAQTAPPEPSQTFQERYFAQTGFIVADYFLQAWENTPNAATVLGYPISQPFLEESFTNPGQLYRVQYFERAILEELPEFYGVDDNRYFVQGRLLGMQLAQGRESEPPFQPVSDPGDGTWIADTQHTLRNDPAPFRSFWEANGGLTTFGKPISEQFKEVNEANGQTYWVQYFERQRIEWHADEPDPQFQVQLGLLGIELRDANHTDNPAFFPLSPDQISEKLLNPQPEQSQPEQSQPVESQPEQSQPVESQPEQSQPVESQPEQSQPRPLAPAPPRTEPFIYGYNAHLYEENSSWQDRGRLLRAAKESGVYWIRQQIAWEDMQDISGEMRWGELDDIVNDVHNADMKLLLSVVRSPSWATADRRNGMPSTDHFGTFANFMGAMAARYQGKVQAYQVWNEQNLAVENGGRVANADHYVNMLAQAYDAIKANDPGAIVVSAAPSSTETNRPDIAVSDVEFMRQMLAHPSFRTDVIGVHPGGQYNPPDAMWPDNPGPGPGWQNSREFYFRRVEDIRQVMVETGYGDYQIWMTEFGWATQNNTPGYEYGNSTSFETQAQWIVRAFEKGRHEYQPWMGGMFLWNLNFAIPWTQKEGNPLHEQASFGVLNGDWSPRPAWYAIQAMPKE